MRNIHAEHTTEVAKRKARDITSNLGSWQHPHKFSKKSTALFSAWVMLVVQGSSTIVDYSHCGSLKASRAWSACSCNWMNLLIFNFLHRTIMHSEPIQVGKMVVLVHPRGVFLSWECMSCVLLDLIQAQYSDFHVSFVSLLENFVWREK